MSQGFVIVWVLVLVLVVVTVFAGAKTVPQGQMWTVERFGAFTRLLSPGLNFLVPFVDRIGRKLNVQEQVLDIPEQSVITGDNATVAVDGVIYYRVLEADKAAYQVQNLAAGPQHPGHDQHPRRDRRDGAGRRAFVARADQHAASGDPGRRHASLGSEGEPGGNPQDRAAGEFDPRHEPANDRRTGTPGVGGEGRGRAAGGGAAGGGAEAGAGAVRRRPPTGGEPGWGGARAAGPGGGGRHPHGGRGGRRGGEPALRYFIADKYVQAFHALATAPNNRLVIVPMESAALAGGITQALELLRAPTAEMAAQASAAANAQAAARATSVPPTPP